MPRHVVEYGLPFKNVADIWVLTAHQFIDMTIKRKFGDIPSESDQNKIKALTTSKHRNNIRAARHGLYSFLEERKKERNCKVRISSISSHATDALDKAIQDRYGLEHTPHTLLRSCARKAGIDFIETRIGDTNPNAPFVTVTSDIIGLKEVRLSPLNTGKRVAKGKRFTEAQLIKAMAIQARLDALHQENPDGVNEFYYVDTQNNFSITRLLIIPESVTVHVTLFNARKCISNPHAPTVEKSLNSRNHTQPDKAPHTTVQTRRGVRPKSPPPNERELQFSEFRGLYDEQLERDRAALPMFSCFRRDIMGQRITKQLTSNMEQVRTYAINNPNSRTAQVLAEDRKRRKQRSRKCKHAG